MVAVASEPVVASANLAVSVVPTARLAHYHFQELIIVDVALGFRRWLLHARYDPHFRVT